MLRAKTHVEQVRSGRTAIIATELPYQVVKSELLKKTAEAINAKRIEGIADLRDESGRAGLRVVYELKSNARADVVTNALFKSTRLQTSFAANIVAIDHDVDAGVQETPGFSGGFPTLEARISVNLGPIRLLLGPLIMLCTSSRDLDTKIARIDSYKVMLK